MRHRLFLMLLSMAILLGLSVTASAGEYTLKITALPTTKAGNDYTGIFKGVLKYGSITENVSLICDDHGGDVYLYEPAWQVKENSINNLSGVEYGPGNHFYKGDSQLQAYAEMLWIADSMLTHPKMPGSQVSIDQFAIWDLFIPTLAPPKGVNDSAELALAQSWWTNTCMPNEASCLAGLSDLIIYTPVTPAGGWPPPYGRPQELVGTPEPASMLLLGSFLSLAGGLLSKKTRRA